MASDNIGFDDPTDFSTTNLQVLDEHLRCPICKELFNTTMLLSSCSHSFCALCIRRSLSAEQKCPKCRKEAVEKNLIHNYDLDNVVRSWKDSRKLLVTLDQHPSVTNATSSAEKIEPLAAHTQILESLPKAPAKLPVRHQDDFDEFQTSLPNKTSKPSPNARRSTRISSQTKSNYVEVQQLESPKVSQPHTQPNLTQDQPLSNTMQNHIQYNSNNPSFQPITMPAQIPQHPSFQVDQPMLYTTQFNQNDNSMRYPVYQSMPNSGQQPMTYTMQPSSSSHPSNVSLSSPSTFTSAPPPPPQTSNPPENASLVECPICQQSMQQAVVNIHLDRCLKGDRSIPVINQSTSNSAHQANSNSNMLNNTVSLTKKKPSVNLGQKPIKQVFGVMKDKEIKALLRSFNLWDHGDRKQMIWRYTEYVTMWNANNDSETPVSAQVLVQRLQRMESSMMTDKNNKLKRKNEDADTHKKHYKDEYVRLIEEVKRRK